MSIFSPSRCVLLLNDEGLGIYDAGGGRAQLIESVPWGTKDFEDAVTSIIRRKCRGKSVLMLNDMVEQHYRKERVPRVGYFDRTNVLKRRVSAAFPSYPMRSAIKLKEKAPKRDGQMTGDIYLLAAVPLSENVRKTLVAVQRSYAAIAGFALLPVESADMVQTLSKKQAKITEKASVWSLFVGQHQSGGLRQIVTKNGELALTRMTPIVDSDIDHDVWVNEVATEIRGTMSYLSRFGFDTSDGLDVTVIANNAVADRVANKIDFDCNLNVLTSVEAASMLGLKIGKQEEMRYADPIHVAWASRKSKLTLPLQALQLEAIANPAKIAMAASLVLLAGCGYYGYNVFTQASAWANNQSAVEGMQSQLTQLRTEHSAEVEKKKAIGIDFLLIESATKVYEKLEADAMKPLKLFDIIGKSLGADIRLTSMTVEPVENARSDSTAFLSPGAEMPSEPEPVVEEGIADKPQEFDIVLRIVFPAKLAPEKGVEKIQELQKRLQENLPDHKVSIAKQVADLSYTGNFVGEATSQTKTTAEQDYEAQILVRGGML